MGEKNITPGLREHAKVYQLKAGKKTACVFASSIQQINSE